MSIIKFFIFAIFFVGIIFNLHLVIAEEKPKPKYKILEHFVNVSDNDWFGTWSSEVFEDGTLVNVSTPILAEVPSEMRVNSTIFINGKPILYRNYTLCESFEKEILIRQMAKFGVPEDKFPKECPVQACEECEVLNFGIPSSWLVRGMKASVIDYSLIIYLDDIDKPIVTTFSKTQIYYDDDDDNDDDDDDSNDKETRDSENEDDAEEKGDKEEEDTDDAKNDNPDDDEPKNDDDNDGHNDDKESDNPKDDEEDSKTN